MSVFGKIATRSSAVMATPIHIHVETAGVQGTAASCRRKRLFLKPFGRNPRIARLPRCNLVRRLSRRLRRASVARQLRALVERRGVVSQAVEIGHQVGALGWP